MRVGTLALLPALPIAAPAKTLEMYVVDVAGKSFLLVSPSGETMVIDAGIPATVDRVVEVCKAVGVQGADRSGKTLCSESRRQGKRLRPPLN